MKKLIIATVALLCAFLLITPQARAQDPVLALDPTLMAGWSGNLAYGNTASKRPAAAKTNFAYTSTPTLRQQVVANFVKRLQTTSPQGAQAVATAFGPGKADYGQVYQQMLKTSALRNNNTADALTGVILVGYQISKNLKDEQVTSAMERGLRTQVTGIIAQNPKMNSATARAQLGEEFKLQTVILALGWQEAMKANTQAAYQQNIAAMFKNQFHLDFSKLQLTDQGFKRK